MVTMHRSTRARGSLLIGCVLAVGFWPLTLAGPAGAHTPRTIRVSTARVASIGTVLTTSSGRTLYRFTRDHAGHATCTGGCAAVWPPLLVPKGERVVGPKGVKGLRVFHGAHGHLQLEFRGSPLYRFSGDARQGQAKGQGVEGTWFAVLARPGVTSTSTSTSSVPSTAPSTAPTGGGAVPLPTPTTPPAAGSTVPLPAPTTPAPSPPTTIAPPAPTTTTTTEAPAPTTTTTTVGPPGGGYGY